MRTKLPKTLSSKEEIELFLTDLIKNGEIFHPEDDARTIIFEGEVSEADKVQLNFLMNRIYELSLLDPCEFILDNQ